jgi:hypothetical protein
MDDADIHRFAQYTIMPSMAFLMSRLYRLSPELTAGVILVGCCPGRQLTTLPQTQTVGLQKLMVETGHERHVDYIFDQSRTSFVRPVPA